MKQKPFTLIFSLCFILILTACGGTQAAPNVAIDEQQAPLQSVNVQENGQGDAETAVSPPTPTSTNTSTSTPATTPTTTQTYPIVDTDQTNCFSESSVIPCGESYNGQDGQYEGLQPAYQDNGNGTVTDLNTGLMWIQDPGEKTYYNDALKKLETYTFAGYDDWRLPTIKELYSLALFSGIDASAANSGSADGLVPFIDTDYFVFLYGDESGGNRVIDSQWLTSTVYDATVMNNTSCFFGFNFADGRIKCYPLEPKQPGAGGYFALFVRGGDDYGVNNYVDNNNSTITDIATGLTWTQNDNGNGMLWDEALTYCESLSLGSSDNWRLPNIKELQSIVDYGRSPDITGSAAIDPLFNLTSITNEAGQQDYPFYWSSTTLISYPNRVADATYISFGRAMGYMEEFGGWTDVHGAGAQRSDAKAGVSANNELGKGPQGDARRSDNYVLCVSDNSTQSSAGSDTATLDLPNGNTANVDTLPASNTQGQSPTVQSGPLAEAAAELGVSEEALHSALGEPGQGRPDFQAVAQQLGITIEALQAALGTPNQSQP
ncbi:MAG: DUF1566 domain-containing protein [Chloroflexi bacterium]|nr:DUF1566 domain-containing protein [Chloroflexota bacterium]